MRVREKPYDFEEGKFSVCQFFNDGTSEYVRRWVSPAEAINAFRHYTESVAVQLGFVDRVIITDELDCVAMEWQRGKGVVFPLPEHLEQESDHGNT